MKRKKYKVRFIVSDFPALTWTGSYEYMANKPYSGKQIAELIAAKHSVSTKTVTILLHECADVRRVWIASSTNGNGTLNAAVCVEQSHRKNPEKWYYPGEASMTRLGKLLENCKPFISFTKHGPSLNYNLVNQPKPAQAMRLAA